MDKDVILCPQSPRQRDEIRRCLSKLELLRFSNRRLLLAMQCVRQTKLHQNTRVTALRYSRKRRELTRFRDNRGDTLQREWANHAQFTREICRFAARESLASGVQYCTRQAA